uniref:Uncharacterized protein n=1 Tax=Rhizophora mucronata TaxID=61149 RepID=A0A2P2J474_RHIMU
MFLCVWERDRERFTKKWTHNFYTCSEISA